MLQNTSSFTISTALQIAIYLKLHYVFSPVSGCFASIRSAHPTHRTISSSGNVERAGLPTIQAQDKGTAVTGRWHNLGGSGLDDMVVEELAHMYVFNKGYGLEEATEKAKAELLFVMWKRLDHFCVLSGLLGHGRGVDSAL